MTRRGRKGMVVWKQWKSEKPWVPKQSTFWVYAVQNIHFNYFLLLFYASPAYIPLASKRVETDPEKPPGLCSSNLSPLTYGKTKAWAEKSFEGYLVSNRAVYIWLRGLTSLVHRDLQNLVDFLPGPALCDWVVACIILCVCVCGLKKTLKVRPALTPQETMSLGMTPGHAKQEATIPGLYSSLPTSCPELLMLTLKTQLESAFVSPVKGQVWAEESLEIKWQGELCGSVKDPGLRNLHAFP